MSALLDNGQLKSVIMNCSFSTEASSCSESGVGSAILPLLACKRDMTSLLVNLGISGKRGRGEAEVSESELILNRAGRIGILREDEKEALTICPKHRKHLTTDWPGRKYCISCYPAHQGLKKRLNLPRRVNAKMSAEIFVEFKEIVPIGAGEWRLLFIHLVNSRTLTCCLGYGTSDTCGSLDCSFMCK